MEKEWKKELILFFQRMGMGINSFFKSRNEEWELIPFFKEEWEWDYNPKNQGMDPCLVNGSAVLFICRLSFLHIHEMAPRLSLFQIQWLDDIIRAPMSICKKGTLLDLS